MTYLADSVAWSGFWLVVGYCLGFIAPISKDAHMTTPERLRRRQRRESAGLALLAILLCVSVVYFRGQDEAQDRCLSTFVETQNETSAIRSKLVERESQATRTVITAALRADSRRDVERAFRNYRIEIRAVDRLRDENPVRMFPGGLCN